MSELSAGRFQKNGDQGGAQPRPGPHFFENSRTKVVLVTGAGRGIGRAAAEALGAQGAAVCVNEINPDSAAETVRAVEAAGGRAQAYLADISKKFSVQGMFNEIDDDWGRLDAVVHCARVTPRRPVLEMDEWEWRRTLEVNLTGAFNILQTAGRVMRAGGGGVIALVVEAPGEMDGYGAVEAARRGVLGLVEAVRGELAEAGVRLEAVVFGRGAEDRAVQSLTGILGGSG